MQSLKDNNQLEQDLNYCPISTITEQTHQISHYDIFNFFYTFTV